MTPDQIFALLAALFAGESDPRFDMLAAGGFDDRYPSTIEACDNAPGVLEVEGVTLVCGTVNVPEDYELPDGRRVVLKFALFNALSQSPAADPLLYLHGGPASGTLDLLGPVAERLFPNHRQTRDIVTFDQRAAALSATSVQCYREVADNMLDLVAVQLGLEAGPEISAMIAPCIAEIQASGADLSAYNTENNARDVSALMSALGYDTYNLYGISYGTRLALEVLRTAPDGVRSAVIDGVAAPTEKIYDALFVPYADTMDALIAQCAEDAACNEAYPDLAEAIPAAFAKLEAEPHAGSHIGPPIDADLLFTLTFQLRNSWRDQQVITPYLPRIFTELARGEATTIRALITSDPATPAEELLRGADNLTADESALLNSIIGIAEATMRLDDAALPALAQLKFNLATDEASLSVAQAFEDRSNTAAMAITDRDAMASLLKDYTLLQRVEPSVEALNTWVGAHFHGDDRDDLLALVSAMSQDDVFKTFAIADTQATIYESILGGTFNVDIYACQEDLPWNSLAGFKAVQSTVATRYPFLGDENFDAFATEFYAQCAHFEQHTRERFHEPIETDIPVLALNGLLDIQTSYHWGENAIQAMGNARSLIVPEAGHGTIAYQPCANDISRAFIADPTAVLDTSCLSQIAPDFLLPDEAFH